MLIKNYIVLTLSSMVFLGCTFKTPQKEIADLVNIPQNIEEFSQKIDFQKPAYKIKNNSFNEQYFSAWRDDFNTTRKEIEWPYNIYKFGNSYGENLQLIKKEFFEEMLNNSNLDKYMHVNKRALTLNHLNMRSFPTSKVLFRDPSTAGEGFPFDYLQNSSIQANKPILVTHYSKDKEWVHIFSSFTHGWVKAKEIVFIDKEYSKRRKTKKHLFITKENIPIYSYDKTFLFKSKIGTILPLLDEDAQNYTVEIVSSLNSNMPLFSKFTIPKDMATNRVLDFNAHNINTIINEVSKSTYGWGGMYNERDCSSSIRDIFIPFGIWLPRNSLKQSKVGEVVKFNEMSSNEKISLIKEKAIPFKTLLYKRGHVMLYVGTYNNEIIVFHNTWGIKTKKNSVYGRVIIGKSIFSTLQVGKNQDFYDEDSELLRNLKSMNILK